MKSRKLFILLGMISAIALSLSACTTPIDAIHEKILSDSGIESNADYNTMQLLQQSDHLDENGLYKSPVPAQEENSNKATGSVQVSFGHNSYLDTLYFFDPELTDAITQDIVYLNPGDIIYVGDWKSNNPHSNLYQLSEYYIFEYAMDGTLIKNISQKPGNDHLLLSIADVHQGHSFSIMPIGIYPDRQLSMSAYYMDDDNEAHSLESSGSWTINDVVCSENTANISSVDSYVLRFTFDKENYFYVSSEPKCFTKSPNQTGFLEFFEEDPTDNTAENYSVELHEYLTLHIKSSDYATVSVNNGTPISVNKNKYIDLDKIQYGDSIIVETAGTCTISGDDRHISIHKDPIGDQFRYTIDVSQQHHENNKEDLPDNVTVNRYFIVTLDTSCPHAECIYELDGKEVEGTISVREDQELIVYGRVIDDGYIFAEKKDCPWYQSKTKYEYTIVISPDLHNSTIVAEDYFNIIKEEGE